jgi:hypothetical protein
MYKTTQSIFSDSETAFHSISTDHPYMNQIGLGVFTTGQLFDWGAERDYKGEFVNLKLIDGANYKPLAPGESIEDRVFKEAAVMLGYEGHDGFEVYNFYPWVPNSNNTFGSYDKTRWDEWENGGFTWNDVDFNDFSNKEFYYVDSIGGLVVGTYKQGFDTDQSQVVPALISMNDYVRLIPLTEWYYD